MAPQIRRLPCFSHLWYGCRGRDGVWAPGAGVVRGVDVSGFRAAGVCRVPCSAEDSHSGLVRTIGNRVGDETPRGFKSRILRQPEVFVCLGRAVPSESKSGSESASSSSTPLLHRCPPLGVSRDAVDVSPPVGPGGVLMLTVPPLATVMVLQTCAERPRRAASIDPPPAASARLGVGPAPHRVWVHGG